MLTNKNSKLLFYSFNDYLNRRGLPVQFFRHTIISNNTYGLSILQENIQCAKNVQIRSSFWSLFPPFLTEYENVLRSELGTLY